MSRLGLLALLLAACRTEPFPEAQVNTAPAATLDSSTGGCRTVAACYFKNGLVTMSCLRDATPHALALLQAAMACIQKSCKTNGQCGEQCALCILNGYTAFTGEPCSTPPDSPGCKAPQCSSEVQACLAD
jgi:hypothetical protein